MQGPRLAHVLAVWPLVVSGCLFTSSLDELEGEPGVCDGRHADCDRSEANGCETDLDTTVMHCGGCGHACPSAPSAAPACVDGSCAIACDIIAGNCDGDDLNGCETAIEKDASHCGACGHACGTANATSSSCEQGACVIECEPGFTSCDGLDATGCEATLTTAEQCGVCSRSCLGGDCTGGDCGGSVLLDHATAIAVAKGTLYVATSQSQCDANNQCTYLRHLRAVAPDGTVTDLFQPSSAINAIAVDASGALYLAGSTLWKYQPGAASPGPTQLIDGVTFGSGISSVEVDATHAYYWSDGLSSNAGLMRVPLAGGSAEQLVPKAGFGFGQQSALALDDSTIYFTNADPTAGLYSLPITGGTPELVLAGEIRSLAAHADGAFFSLETDSETIYRAAHGQVTQLIGSQAGPDQLSTDGTELWWWNRDAGSLQRAALDGSGVKSAFAQPAAGAALLALDAQAIFWLVPQSGQLNRLAR